MYLSLHENVVFEFWPDATKIGLCSWNVSYRVIQEHKGPHRAMQSHVGPCKAMRSYAGQWGAMRCHVGPCGTMWDHVWSCGTIRDHKGPCRTIWDHVWPCGTIRHHTGPYGTIQDLTALYKTAGDHSSLKVDMCAYVSEWVCEFLIHRVAHTTKKLKTAWRP